MTSKARSLAQTLGSAALLAVPASAAAAPEPGPNDTFPGPAAVVGTTYNGALCDDCVPPPDTIDFYHYTGLAAGAHFDFSFDPLFIEFPGDTLQAGRYTDAFTIADSKTSDGPLVHLTGTIPGSGELVFGITYGTAFGFESYTAVLNVTGVPEPASIALLGVGLSALALQVARRKKQS